MDIPIFKYYLDKICDSNNVLEEKGNFLEFLLKTYSSKILIK